MTNLPAAALRGERTCLQALDGPADCAAFLDVAARYGIEPLLRRHLKEQGVWSSLPAALSAALDASARREAVLEELRCREIKRVLAALYAADVPNLVLKGAALAYTHYPAAYLRPRADTDLLVRQDDRANAVRALGRLGYRRFNSISRDAVHTQWLLKRNEGSFVHALDLHWAISNRPLFAGMLTFDELVANAASIPALGAAALAPWRVHSLLLACIHRVAHHDDSPNLLWLYDIKLLATDLSRAEWAEFWNLACGKRLVSLCLRGLELMSSLLGCSPTVKEGIMTHPPATGDPEASATYLGAAAPHWRSLWLDLKGAAGPFARVRLLAGHTFPDPSYMRLAYGATGPLTLIAAYARRASNGFWRLISKSGWRSPATEL